MDFGKFYKQFAMPLAPLDCGEMCSVHNADGKPFCCDICHAVPAAYLLEWDHLQLCTDFWHEYRGDECPDGSENPEDLLAETPEHMLLLACKGPAYCERENRTIGCRQFPFFPYINSNGRFLGLAYEWTFETRCWVISNLDVVTTGYRQAFVQLYDTLFARWEYDLESYAFLSEEARAYFLEQKRRIPLLHRNGGYYLVSPGSERMRRIQPQAFQKFGPYR